MFTRLSLCASASSLARHALKAECLYYYSTNFSQTSVFFQTGLKICELPMVVQKVHDVLKIGDVGQRLDDKRSIQGKYSLATKVNPEIAEILSGFNRCSSVGEMLRLLEMIPADEVVPVVAVHALKRIIYLQNSENKSAKNFTDNTQHPSFLPVSEVPQSLNQKASKTFLKFAFMNILFDIVVVSKDASILLEGLTLLCADGVPMTGDQISFYKDKIYDEVISLMTTGKFTLEQICEAIVLLSKFYPDDPKRCEELVDKLWPGVMDKSKDISVDNVSVVFRTLPCLKQSRGVVLKLLESKVGDFWRHYSTRDVLEVLKSLTMIQFGSSKVLQVTSQWLSVNIQSLTEEELLAFVCCYSTLEFKDDVLVSTLEKYMKLRGCKIKEKDLVAAICDYCFQFKIRSKPILEGAGEYFIEHGTSLNTPQIFSISRLYGELDFHPPNGFKFWQVLEHVLEHKFVEFPPKEVIDLLLSFVYIERFPINFVRKIFNPYFMERLHNQSEKDIFYTRQQLKLFDSAMKMDCPHYGGPFLPHESKHRVIKHDPIAEKLATQLVSPLADIVGDVKRIGKTVVLASLPLHPLYVVDLMVYPSVAASFLRFGLKTTNTQNVAILIHSKDHYDFSGNNLTGPQAMRKRHLIKMGFKVVELSLNDFVNKGYQKNQLRQLLFRHFESVTDFT